MSFDEQITTLSERLPKITGHLKTEEASKNALVMPFIAALGYDIFDPQEVIPEYITDVVAYDGQKIDYAVKYKGEIVMVIECEKPGTELSGLEIGKLGGYFIATSAKIALLTDGVHYRFYCSTKDPDKMDKRPFLKFDLSDFRPGQLAEVKKFTKENVDLERMLSAPSEAKFTSECKRILATQIQFPDQELVQFFFSRVNPGMQFTDSVKDLFTPLVSRALKQFIRERIGERLGSALYGDDYEEQDGPDEVTLDEMVTAGTEIAGRITEEDVVEGYRIVKAIITLPKSKPKHQEQIAELTAEVERLSAELQKAENELVTRNVPEARAGPPPVPGTTKIVCNKFELVMTKVDDTTIGISLDTDLPDMTEIEITVSRSYQEKGDSAAYTMEYSTEQSTVGKWRAKHEISIDNEKWIALLKQKQKELSRLGLGLNVGSVNQNVKVKVIVPLQENPRFGKKNANLVGKAVKKNGFNTIEREIFLDYPLEVSLLKSIDVPSLDPRGLDVGTTYLLSEDTPIMAPPGSGDADPPPDQKIPAKCYIHIRSVAQEKGNPVYKVSVLDPRKNNAGSAWVNSLALVGQRLEIEE